jgi:hypothetical protein
MRGFDAPAAPSARYTTRIRPGTEVLR